MRVHCPVYPRQQEALLWLFPRTSLIEGGKSLLDSDDQRSQVTEREFREMALCMDHAESLSLDDPPSLVLRETTPLLCPPHNQGFSPCIAEFGLWVIDEKG